MLRRRQAASLPIRRAAANRLRLVEQDEFLAAAPLLRHGPWALMLVGALLSVSVLVASLWRIDVSRAVEYERALQFASTSATEVHASSLKLFALLHQATYSLHGTSHPLADTAGALREQFASGLGLQDPQIRALAVAADGQVLAVSAGLTPDAPALRRVVARLPAAGWVGAAVLPAMDFGDGAPRVVPVAYALNMDGASAVVYLVDADAFKAGFLGTLGDKAGWLRLTDRAGTTLLEVHRGVAPSDTGAPALLAAARSTAQAMSGPGGYASHRLLLASAAAPGAPLSVTVGLDEAGALKDLKVRVQTTWVIFVTAIFVVMSLVTVTSLALRKFAIKETHLRRLATIDILTGLPNRSSFQELLDKAVQTSHRRQQIFGLLFVDLDNFKDINDSMGHEAGDALLHRVAELLVGAVHAEHRVCRLGGDEFTVLLTGLRDADEARRIGQHILETLAVPVRVRDFEIQTRASIGIALMPQHASTTSDLMRFADTAMHRAKQGGKGLCMVYDGSMAVQALEKAQRVRELTHAIAHDELFLEYQPKFHLADETLSGHEALVRWRHPQRGVVGPGDFIALAEEAGLIVDLGNWVLGRAVRQQREWHDAGAGWQKVAVNVSALQLRGGDFATRVAAVLQRHQVPGTQLQLELTESSLVIDAEQARDFVRAVRALGLSVAVDDFGTGYSSLAALRQFDIDCLKVDRGFVDAIQTPAGEAICNAIVSLGHALKMQVVAEGVETAAQRDVLRRLGCDEVQGFFYARSMAADKVLRLALQSRANGLRPAAEPVPAPA